MKESSSSRTLCSIFLILSLNDCFGSSLRELDISFHSLAPILKKVFFFMLRFNLFDVSQTYNLCSSAFTAYSNDLRFNKMYKAYTGKILVSSAKR